MLHFFDLFILVSYQVACSVLSDYSKLHVAWNTKSIYAEFAEKNVLASIPCKGM